MHSARQKKQEITLHNSTRPLTDTERQIAKDTILQVLAETNIVQKAIDAAGVTRMTYLAWIENGTLAQEELNAAYKQYQDTIRAELDKRTFQGELQPLVSNGRLVFDRQGNQVFISKKNDRMLLELARRHLEEWQGIDSRQEITIHSALGDIPQQYLIQIDSRELTSEEWQQLEQLLYTIEERKKKIVDSVSS